MVRVKNALIPVFGFLFYFSDFTEFKIDLFHPKRKAIFARFTPKKLIFSEFL